MIGDPLLATRRPVPWRMGVLLPVAVVLMLVWVEGTMPDTSDPRCPAGVDGPQFYCWLQEHPDGSP